LLINTTYLLLIGIVLLVLGFDLQNRLGNPRMKFEAVLLALIGLVFVLAVLGFLNLS
jgi:hypothetical protein